MKGKHFIVFVHVYRPGEGARTEAKGYGIDGKWNMQEEVYFLDKVSDKFLTRATAILDYDNNKVIKDRIGSLTPEKMLSHVEQNYPDQYLKFIKVISLDKKSKG
jgi:hypothetical protein|tara:strand:- start:1622 stop:1933 length:312 start_codon:yes stop_codon:yes gene_type:complete